jgi:hypothetical protein
VSTRTTTNHAEISNMSNPLFDNIDVRQTIRVGGNSTDGDIAVFPSQATATDMNDHNKATIHLDGAAAKIVAGGGGPSGSLTLREGAGKPTIHLDGAAAKIFAGGGGQSGSLTLREGVGKPTIHLDGAAADIFAGGSGQDGRLVLRNNDEKPIFTGGGGPSGSLTLHERQGGATIHLDGAAAHIFAGGGGPSGFLTLREGLEGDPTIHLDGAAADIFAGGCGQDGRLVLRNKKGDEPIDIDAALGKVTLPNADCAEYFDVAAASVADPGTVMVIGKDGRISESSDAYDKRVAGVVSGAGEYRPAIVLDQRVSAERRVPLGLMGKVYCKVDARFAAIEVGDLLTTSPTAGHAMKASDPARAFGCVIGKALRPLREGTGLIPILIALQ